MPGDTPIQIQVDAGALAKLARAWREAPELVVEEMTASATEASLLVEREVRERTPIGVGGGGGLAGSIGAREPQVLGEEVIGTVSTSLRYAIPVELGRRPGGRQPPVEPLADWAVARLGVSHDEAAGRGVRHRAQDRAPGHEGREHVPRRRGGQRRGGRAHLRRRRGARGGAPRGGQGMSVQAAANLEAQRALLCSRIQAAANAALGISADKGAQESVPVHGFERYAAREGDLRKFYLLGARLVGWHVRRVATLELEDSAGYTRAANRWRAVGILALNDPGMGTAPKDGTGEASEIAFDRMLECVRAAFRVDDALLDGDALVARPRATRAARASRSTTRGPRCSPACSATWRAAPSSRCAPRRSASRRPTTSSQPAPTSRAGTRRPSTATRNRRSRTSKTSPR